MSNTAAKICVAVRKRPIFNDDKDVVNCNSHTNLIVNEPRIKYDLTPYTERHNFNFDEVFDEKCNNREVYLRAAQPLIDTVFQKGSASIFAYGQTGSGKTYTMIGSSKEPGLYEYASHDIFARAQKQNCAVFASFYEIYGRKLFDLLNDRAKLVCREDGNSQIQICGLTEHPVSKIEELLKIIDAGSASRAAGQTSANAESSRSHAVLTLEIREIKDQKPLGKMSFIDLAGNERGSDTFDSDRKTRIEGAEINKSLLALKECIRALGMGKNHVPFRGSILTEVLRDSFLGNSRTCMIAAISPASPNCEHTLNTLRYTSRVKELGPGGKPASNKSDAVTNPAQRYKRENDADSKAVRNNNNRNNNNNNNNNNKDPQQQQLDAKYEARAAALAERLAGENNNNNNNLPPLSSGASNASNASKQQQQQQQPNKGRRAVSNNVPSNNNNNKAGNNNNRPAWTSEFTEENVLSGGAESGGAGPNPRSNSNPVVGSNNNKVGSNRRVAGGGAGGPSLQPRHQQNIKNNNNNKAVKDPLIQTIIQNHINQLDEIEAAASDDDDDDDDENEDNNNNNMRSNNDDDNNNEDRRKISSSMKKARAVHQHIVARIRQSEESMISVHRRHIDSKMAMMKGEVAQLQELDDNSSIDDYVEKVDSLLAKQMKEIKDMRDRLAKIGTYLKEEEVLSKTLTPAGKKRM